jgi:hypothetical protein
MYNRNPISLTPEVVATFTVGMTIILDGQEATFLELNPKDRTWGEPAIKFYNHPSIAGGWAKLSSVQYDPMHTRPKLHLVFNHYNDGEGAFQSHEISCESPELAIETQDTGYGKDTHSAVLAYREIIARNIVKLQQQLSCIEHGNYSISHVDS